MSLIQVPLATAVSRFLYLRRDQFSSDRWRPPKPSPAQYSTVASTSFQLLLAEPPAPGWLLRQPIWLTVERDRSTPETQVVVYDSFVNVYGAGTTPQEAIAEFKSMLLDLYQELENSQHILSPTLRRRWQNLRSLMQRA